MSPRSRLGRPRISGAAIQAWRKKKGIGQLEIAKKLGYSLSHISKIETGKTQPTDRFLDGLRQHFKAQLEVFHEP